MLVQAQDFRSFLTAENGGCTSLQVHAVDSHAFPALAVAASGVASTKKHAVICPGVRLGDMTAAPRLPPQTALARLMEMAEAY